MKNSFTNGSRHIGLISTVIFALVACGRPAPPRGSTTTGPSATTPRSAPAASPELPVVHPTPPMAVSPENPASTAKKACVDARYTDRFTPGYRIAPEAAAAADKMLARLSLSERADQIRGTPKGTQNAMNWKDIFRSPDNPKKRLRGFLFRDGPRGVNLDAECPPEAACTATVFPVEIARGAAFDTDLEYRIGRATGDETVAAGYTMMLAPSINILRHPAWGRAQESYGEDAFLLGKLGTAYVVGVQEYVPACSKHFIANNVEVKRQESNAVMDEQTLREVYGSAYEMTIRDGGVACVMASYNRVRGVNVAENRHVLTEVLRDDFGFQGFVISDWWALANPFKVNLPASVYEASAKKSLEAGLDMEMPWSLNYAHLESLVQKGAIDPALIDRSARRVLREKYRFNIADMDGAIGLRPPDTRLGDGRSIKDNRSHLELAYEAALESAVLLKNANETLPIDRRKVKTVAVLGANVPYEQHKYASKPSGRIDFSTDVTLGDLGSSRVNADAKDSIGPFDGIRMAAGTDITVVRGNTPDAAKSADFIVVVAGLTPGDEGEEYTGAGDRRSFALDAKIDGTPQTDLIQGAIALGKPMVVVLVGGSIIDMPWRDAVPAVVMSWYSGVHGGRALGDLLFGKSNFSGKLPLTWPRTWDALPDFDPGAPNPVEMDYYLGYRYYDQKGISPLYPFGHGQSYTRFGYANLQVPCRTVTRNGVVEVKVDVTNTGARAGEDVVLLFVSYPDGKTRRSVKELKGFTRVALNPNETRRVTLPLRVRDLRYWNRETAQWQVAPGTVKVMVGGSATNLPLSDVFEVI